MAQMPPATQNFPPTRLQALPPASAPRWKRSLYSNAEPHTGHLASFGSQTCPPAHHSALQRPTLPTQGFFPCSGWGLWQHRLIDHASIVIQNPHDRLRSKEILGGQEYGQYQMRLKGSLQPQSSAGSTPNLTRCQQCKTRSDTQIAASGLPGPQRPLVLGQFRILKQLFLRITSTWRRQICEPD